MAFRTPETEGQQGEQFIPGGVHRSCAQMESIQLRLLATVNTRTRYEQPVGPIPTNEVLTILQADLFTIFWRLRPAIGLFTAFCPIRPDHVSHGGVPHP